MWQTARLTDSLRKGLWGELVKPEELFTWKQSGLEALFDNCESPWEPLLRLRSFANQIEGNGLKQSFPSSVTLVRPETIYFGEGCIVEPGAYIAGPCWLGAGTTIRHGAYLRGYVVTAPHCLIGHATEVKESLLLEGAKAAHFAYLGNAILGQGVNLGAGVKCANVRLRGGQVVVTLKDGRRVPSGLTKLGAMIGDRAQIGCNAVISPGSIIGRHSLWYPCIHRSGFFPDHAVIR